MLSKRPLKILLLDRYQSLQDTVAKHDTPFQIFKYLKYLKPKGMWFTINIKVLLLKTIVLCMLGWALEQRKTIIVSTPLIGSGETSHLLLQRHGGQITCSVRGLYLKLNTLMVHVLYQFGSPVKWCGFFKFWEVSCKTREFGL